ncbi:Glucosyl-3-phosphoglycerate phosphatase [Photobacterium malacitanum]|uniref:Glucosyl-3-phosphoglycerate phosphatase n=1 Tax=Photobacterium malacitanum TaxID=2204294 RepID=A0A1Y6MB04_9GAMM|nr:histidine phosphatase family protein [Photobacterium malacitanum]SMY33726.1 Glucosyl-3-phosphoglycerate phosphatase [Photobacterium malacitanum]
MSKSIFLLRHGQTVFNAQQRLQGHCNSKLTDLGQQQALAIGLSLKTKLANKSQWTIYSSPLGRAVQTAEIVAQQIGIDPNQIVQDPRLQEFCLGDWEQAYIPDLKMKQPRLCEQKDWYLMAPNAESYFNVKDRIEDFLADISVSENAIVISHGLTGAVFRGVYVGMTYDEVFSQDLPQDAYFLLANDKISRIQCDIHSVMSLTV